MSRAVLFILCLFASSLNAFAQLPNQRGQVWGEYHVVVPNTHALVGELPTPLSIVEYIRRETGGEAAWTGENFGLISGDGRKLFVYHSPAMQQRIAEIVARFMRPETREILFATEHQYYTLSNHLAGAKGITDVRQLMYQYLHPLLTPDGDRSVCKTPGVSAYWVAKEDIPKVLEKLPNASALATLDKGSSVLQCPKVMAYNGQTAGIRDVTTLPFVTDVAPVRAEGQTGYQPILRMFEQGQTTQTMSLLSWDRRTVTTDVSMVFSKIKETDIVNVGTSEFPISFQVPRTQIIEVSEHGLVWPSEGMLVVCVGGLEREREFQVEAGVPVLNKIPYANRLFSNTAVVQETRSVHCVLTVRMADELSQPQQATRQGNVR